MKNEKRTFKQSVASCSKLCLVRRIDRIRTGIRAGVEYVDPSGQMKVIDYGPGLSPRM